MKDIANILVHDYFSFSNFAGLVQFYIVCAFQDGCTYLTNKWDFL